MTIPMTEKLQLFILMLQAYKKYCDYEVQYFGNQKTASGYDLAYHFFRLMDGFPEGLKRSRACFDAVLSYPIEQTMNTQAEDLPQHYSFGF